MTNKKETQTLNNTNFKKLTRKRFKKNNKKTRKSLIGGAGPIRHFGLEDVNPAYTQFPNLSIPTPGISMFQPETGSGIPMFQPETESEKKGWGTLASGLASGFTNLFSSGKVPGLADIKEQDIIKLITNSGQEAAINFLVKKSGVPGSRLIVEQAVKGITNSLQPTNVNNKSSSAPEKKGWFNWFRGNQTVPGPEVSPDCPQPISPEESITNVTLKSMIDAVAAAGGVVANNPAKTLALTKVATTLMQNPNVVNNIKDMSYAVSGALNSQIDNLGDKLAQGVFTGVEKGSEASAQAVATFKDYMDKINDDYAPNNHNIRLNQSVLSRYGVNINKAYQGLGGYEREVDPQLRLLEKDLISSSYKKFAELQWKAEIADIETKINKPYYDEEEDFEVRRKIWEKMTVAFANKTAQLAIQNFEVSFKNDLVFSNNPCDLEYFKHLGRSLSLAQYNMFSVAKQSNNKDIMAMMNLPFKVFIYKLWFLCCLHCNYNPYLNDDADANLNLKADTYALLPEYIMNNLGYFEDFTDIIQSKGLDKDVEDLIKKNSYVFPLKDKGLMTGRYSNPLTIIPKALTDFRNTIIEGNKASMLNLFGDAQTRVKKANISTMKVCYKVSQLVVEKYMNGKDDLNHWDRLVTVIYALKIIIYISLFVFWRVDLNRDTTSFGTSNWVKVIKTKSNKVDVNDVIQISNYVILFNKLKRALEMEGINSDSQKKTSQSGGMMSSNNGETLRQELDRDNRLTKEQLITIINNSRNLSNGVFVNTQTTNVSVNQWNCALLKTLTKPIIYIGREQLDTLESSTKLNVFKSDGPKQKLDIKKDLYIYALKNMKNMPQYRYLFNENLEDIEYHQEEPPDTLTIDYLLEYINQKKMVSESSFPPELNKLINKTIGYFQTPKVKYQPAPTSGIPTTGTINSILEEIYDRDRRHVIPWKEKTQYWINLEQAFFDEDLDDTERLLIHVNEKIIPLLGQDVNSDEPTSDGHKLSEYFQHVLESQVKAVEEGQKSSDENKKSIIASPDDIARAQKITKFASGTWYNEILKKSKINFSNFDKLVNPDLIKKITSNNDLPSKRKHLKEALIEVLSFKLWDAIGKEKEKMGLVSALRILAGIDFAKKNENEWASEKNVEIQPYMFELEEKENVKYLVKNSNLEFSKKALIPWMVFSTFYCVYSGKQNPLRPVYKQNRYSSLFKHPYLLTMQPLIFCYVRELKYLCKKIEQQIELNKEQGDLLTVLRGLKDKIRQLLNYREIKEELIGECRGRDYSEPEDESSEIEDPSKEPDSIAPKEEKNILEDLLFNQNYESRKTRNRTIDIVSFLKAYGKINLGEKRKITFTAKKNQPAAAAVPLSGGRGGQAGGTRRKGGTVGALGEDMGDDDDVNFDDGSRFSSFPRESRGRTLGSLRGSDNDDDNFGLSIANLSSSRASRGSASSPSLNVDSSASTDIEKTITLDPIIEAVDDLIGGINHDSNGFELFPLSVLDYSYLLMVKAEYTITFENLKDNDHLNFFEGEDGTKTFGPGSHVVKLDGLIKSLRRESIGQFSLPRVAQREGGNSLKYPDNDEVCEPISGGAVPVKSKGYFSQYLCKEKQAPRIDKIYDSDIQTRLLIDLETLEDYIENKSDFEMLSIIGEFHSKYVVTDYDDDMKIYKQEIKNGKDFYKYISNELDTLSVETLTKKTTIEPIPEMLPMYQFFSRFYFDEAHTLTEQLLGGLRKKKKNPSVSGATVKTFYANEFYQLSKGLVKFGHREFDLMRLHFNPSDIGGMSYLIDSLDNTPEGLTWEEVQVQLCEFMNKRYMLTSNPDNIVEMDYSEGFFTYNGKELTSEEVSFSKGRLVEFNGMIGMVSIVKPESRPHYICPPHGLSSDEKKAILRKKPVEAMYTVDTSNLKPVDISVSKAVAQTPKVITVLKSNLGKVYENLTTISGDWTNQAEELDTKDSTNFLTKMKKLFRSPRTLNLTRLLLEKNGSEQTFTPISKQKLDEFTPDITSSEERETPSDDIDKNVAEEILNITSEHQEIRNIENLKTLEKKLLDKQNQLGRMNVREPDYERVKKEIDELQRDVESLGAKVKDTELRILREKGITPEDGEKLVTEAFDALKETGLSNDQEILEQIKISLKETYKRLGFKDQDKFDDSLKVSLSDLNKNVQFDEGVHEGGGGGKVATAMAGVAGLAIAGAVANRYKGLLNSIGLSTFEKENKGGEIQVPNSRENPEPSAPPVPQAEVIIPVGATPVPKSPEEVRQSQERITSINVDDDGKSIVPDNAENKTEIELPSGTYNVEEINRAWYQKQKSIKKSELVSLDIDNCLKILVGICYVQAESYWRLKKEEDNLESDNKDGFKQFWKLSYKKLVTLNLITLIIGGMELVRKNERTLNDVLARLKPGIRKGMVTAAGLAACYILYQYLFGKKSRSGGKIVKKKRKQKGGVRDSAKKDEETIGSVDLNKLITKTQAILEFVNSYLDARKIIKDESINEKKNTHGAILIDGNGFCQLNEFKSNGVGPFQVVIGERTIEQLQMQEQNNPTSLDNDGSITQQFVQIEKVILNQFGGENKGYITDCIEFKKKQTMLALSLIIEQDDNEALRRYHFETIKSYIDQYSGHEASFTGSESYHKKLILECSNIFTEYAKQLQSDQKWGELIKTLAVGAAATAAVVGTGYVIGTTMLTSLTTNTSPLILALQGITGDRIPETWLQLLKMGDLKSLMSAIKNMSPDVWEKLCKSEAASLFFDDISQKIRNIKDNSSIPTTLIATVSSLGITYSLNENVQFYVQSFLWNLPYYRKAIRLGKNIGGFSYTSTSQVEKYWQEDSETFTHLINNNSDKMNALKQMKILSELGISGIYDKNICVQKDISINQDNDTTNLLKLSLFIAHGDDKFKSESLWSIDHKEQKIYPSNNPQYNSKTSGNIYTYFSILNALCGTYNEHIDSFLESLSKESQDLYKAYKSSFDQYTINGFIQIINPTQEEQQISDTINQYIGSKLAVMNEENKLRETLKSILVEGTIKNIRKGTEDPFKLGLSFSIQGKHFSNKVFDPLVLVGPVKDIDNGDLKFLEDKNYFGLFNEMKSFIKSSYKELLDDIKKEKYSDNISKFTKLHRDIKGMTAQAFEHFKPKTETEPETMFQSISRNVFTQENIQRATTIISYISAVLMQLPRDYNSEASLIKKKLKGLGGGGKTNYLLKKKKLKQKKYKRNRELIGGAEGDDNIKMVLKETFEEKLGEDSMKKKSLPFDSKIYKEAEKKFMDTFIESSGGVKDSNLFQEEDRGLEGETKLEEEIKKAYQGVEELLKREKSKEQKKLNETKEMLKDYRYDNVKVNFGDVQYLEALEIDKDLMPGFFQENNFGENDDDNWAVSGLKKLKKTYNASMDTQLPQPIFDNPNTLNTIRRTSSKFIMGSSLEIGQSNNIVCSMVFMSAGTQLIDYNEQLDQRLKQEGLKSSYDSNNANYLQSGNSRGFRNYENQVWKGAANVAKKTTDFAGSFLRSAIETVGDISGNQGVAAAVTGKSIAVSRSLDKLTDARRSKRYFPILTAVVCEVERVSETEYLVRILNTENEMYFADFNNNYIKPIFKISVQGNRCIYQYYTTLLNNSNPYLKEEQYGQTAYYIGDRDRWLPYEDASYSDVGIQKCEILFYPLTPIKMFSQNFGTEFKPFFWSMCMEQVITSYEKSYLSNQDRILQKLFSRKIDGVDPNVVNVSLKKTYDKIFDHDSNYTNKFSYIHYVSQQLLESAYTENKKELSTTIRDMIIQFYNVNSNYSAFQTWIREEDINNKFEILIGYSASSIENILGRLGVLKKKREELLDKIKINSVFSRILNSDRRAFLLSKSNREKYVAQARESGYDSFSKGIIEADDGQKKDLMTSKIVLIPGFQADEFLNWLEERYNNEKKMHINSWDINPYSKGTETSYVPYLGEPLELGTIEKVAKRAANAATAAPAATAATAEAKEAAIKAAEEAAIKAAKEEAAITEAKEAEIKAAVEEAAITEAKRREEVIKETVEEAKKGAKAIAETVAEAVKKNNPSNLSVKKVKEALIEKLALKKGDFIYQIKFTNSEGDKEIVRLDMNATKTTLLDKAKNIVTGYSDLARNKIRQKIINNRIQFTSITVYYINNKHKDRVKDIINTLGEAAKLTYDADEVGKKKEDPYKTIFGNIPGLQPFYGKTRYMESRGLGQNVYESFFKPEHEKEITDTINYIINKGSSSNNPSKRQIKGMLGNYVGRFERIYDHYSQKRIKIDKKEQAILEEIKELDQEMMNILNVNKEKLLNPQVEKIYFFQKDTFVEIVLTQEQSRQLYVGGGGQTGASIFGNFFSSSSRKKKFAEKKIREDKFNQDILEKKKPTKSVVDVVKVDKDSEILFKEVSSGDDPQFEITISYQDKGVLYDSTKAVRKVTEPFRILNIQNEVSEIEKKKKIDNWKKQFHLLSKEPKKHQLLSLLQSISKEEYKPDKSWLEYVKRKTVGSTQKKKGTSIFAT